MAGKVWVYAEADGDKVTSATLEILTKAREVGDTVEAIYSGSGDTAAIAEQVGSHGATKLFAIDPGDGLPGQVAAAGIAALAGEHNPDTILFAQSYDGRDALRACRSSSTGPCSPTACRSAPTARSAPRSSVV